MHSCAHDIRALSDITRVTLERIDPSGKGRQNDTTVRGHVEYRFDAREIIHDIAVCCFRTYEVCSVKAIKLLIAYNGSSATGYDRKAQIDPLIKDALQRKIEDWDIRKRDDFRATPLSIAQSEPHRFGLLPMHIEGT
jgi:hypothetical protein